MKLYHSLILYILSALLFNGCKDNPKGTLIMVPAEPSGKFNFPYYLFIPDETSGDTIIPLIIEPNNSGYASDNFDEHMEKASRTASLHYYVGNYLAINLRTCHNFYTWASRMRMMPYPMMMAMMRMKE